jgi:hypothetical protein
MPPSNIAGDVKQLSYKASASESNKVAMNLTQFLIFCSVILAILKLAGFPLTWLWVLFPIWGFFALVGLALLGLLGLGILAGLGDWINRVWD